MKKDDIKLGEVMPVRFEVKKIRFRSTDNGYTIFEAKFLSYPSNSVPTSEIIISGDFMSIMPEDEFEGEGKWVHHKIYGYQFSMNWTKRLIPQSLKGISAFMKRYIKGVGKKADKIVERFGVDTLNVIQEDWTRLMDIPGIGEKTAKKIGEKINTNIKYEEVAMFVLSHGLGYKVAMKIFDAFGEGAVLKIRENPYNLCSVKNIGFVTADKFAKNLGFAYDSPMRIEEGLKAFLDYSARSEGNLFIYKDSIYQDFSKFLRNCRTFDMNKNISKEAIDSALKNLSTEIEPKIVIKTDGENRELVYLSFYHFIEEQIVYNLGKRTEPIAPICTKEQIEKFLDSYQSKHNLTLADKQKEAVMMAIMKPLSILTGGPGTGKTQTINTIIQCIKSLKPNAVIKLSAPTGKASKRMTELTNMEASTIHRLIGLNPFEGSELEPIEADFLIVDESSMIDAYIFHLILSLTEGDTKILFVGDYEQLPSVGPGLILRDLINSKKIPTTTLTEIFRQAKESQIVMNSHKIIQGKGTNDTDGLTFEQKKNDFFFFERKSAQEIQRTIMDCIERLVKNQGYKLQDIQLLCPMKKGDIGVNTLNLKMQSLFNPYDERKPEYRISETSVMRVGDRVMQMVNNYDLMVFNGEVGNIVSIARNEDDEMVVTVDYEDKIVDYDYLSIEEIQLAYATTIHKSQGSEFPIVIMPMHRTHNIMLNKNLIYTAWTRAKKMVINVGEKETLNEAILKDDGISRNSMIKEKIISKF